MLRHPQVCTADLNREVLAIISFSKMRLTFEKRKSLTPLTVIALPLKHKLTLPPVVSKLQIVPCRNRQTAGSEWLKYQELFKTKGSMPQRYFRNMLLHSEKCSWIIICMLKAVYFVCSVYYYFWKILPWIWNPKCIQMASVLDIKKDQLL